MANDDRAKWNDKWASRGKGTDHGSKLVDLLSPWLPESGSLLDIAGGGSSASLEFARLGLDVTVCDVSDVGLAQAEEQAQAEGLVVSTVLADLQNEPIPAGPWDVITIANYLQRDLFAGMIGRLAPGGLLVVAIPTVTNLQRHDRPGRPFSLDPGELLNLIGGLEILHHREEWGPNGRHEAHLVAQSRLL